MNPKEIAARVKALYDQGASDDEVHAYITHVLGGVESDPNTALHAEYQSGRLAKRVARENTNDREMAAADVPLNAAQRGLAAVANTAGGIPGVEAAQAGLAAAVNGIPYAQAYGDIKNAEGDINPIASFLNRGAGAAIVAPLLPGSAAVQGAIFGGASGVLNADPNAGLEHRVLSGAGQAIAGAAAGKIAEGVGNLARSLRAPSPGRQALSLRKAISDADVVNYPQAAAEGQAAITGPSVAPDAAAVENLGNALDGPTVLEYTAAVRQSPRFANADAPTVAQEVYRQMSADQRMLSGRMAVDPMNFKAASGLRADDIAAAKQTLLDAIDPVMPSFRGAVQEHATLAGEQGAAQVASDATRRVMRHGAVPFKKLTTASPEGVMRELGTMDPGEAQAAQDAILARVREHAAGSLTVNPLKGFGVPSALNAAARATPLLNAADQSAGAASMTTAAPTTLGLPTPSGVPQRTLPLGALLRSYLASLPSTLINR